MECVFDGIMMMMMTMMMMMMMMMMMSILWICRSGIWSGEVGNQGLPDADPTFSPIISISPQRSKRFSGTLSSFIKEAHFQEGINKKLPPASLFPLLTTKIAF